MTRTVVRCISAAYAGRGKDARWRLVDRPSAAMLDHRDVQRAHDDALDALIRFGNYSRRWNDPDDEYTRRQMIAMLDEALEEVGLAR